MVHRHQARSSIAQEHVAHQLAGALRLANTLLGEIEVWQSPVHEALRVVDLAMADEMDFQHGFEHLRAPGANPLKRR